MKIRSQLFTLFAFVLLSWNASASPAARPRLQSKRPAIPVQEFGSVERTKLLRMGAGCGASEGAKRLGSVERRTLLTTGKPLRLPVKQPSTVRHYRR